MEKIKRSSNQIEITALGQAGFKIQTSVMTLLIDPYLTNSIDESAIEQKGIFVREFPPPYQPNDLRGVDFIFITHNHGDHFDLETLIPILKNNPDCMIIGPKPVMKMLTDKEISNRNLILCKNHLHKNIPGGYFFSVPAAHYELFIDEDGNTPCVGFVIKIEGITIYHAGDTIPYQRITEYILQDEPGIDLVFLPVNGRDMLRESIGIIGNMDGLEALALAQTVRARLVIPMHNDLFKNNRSDPELINNLLLTRYPQLNLQWLNPGEEIIFQ